MAEITERGSHSPKPFPENQRGLLAWLAKFRYALCLQSFATRLACQVSLRALFAKNSLFNSRNSSRDLSA